MEYIRTTAFETRKSKQEIVAEALRITGRIKSFPEAKPNALKFQPGHIRVL
jgi:hypothetical protein